MTGPQGGEHMKDHKEGQRAPSASEDCGSSSVLSLGMKCVCYCSPLQFKAEVTNLCPLDCLCSWICCVWPVQCLNSWTKFKHGRIHKNLHFKRLLKKHIFFFFFSKIGAVCLFVSNLLETCRDIPASWSLPFSFTLILSRPALPMTVSRQALVGVLFEIPDLRF